MRLNGLASAAVLATLSVGPSAPTLYAQISVGRITGTVIDETGAVVPGARIALTNTATNDSQVIQSSSSGSYALQSVNPGSYTLTIESPGFASQTFSNVQVHIQQTVTLDITLKTGGASESVTVTAAAPLLQAQDASVGQTMDTAQVNNLPLNGRNWVSLGQLAAGVTTNAGGNPGSTQFTANGINFQQNDFRLNGVDDDLEIFGTGGSIAIQGNASVVPAPDAVQEFKIQSGNFSAEFGHSAGAVVNAVVKSGANKVSGVLWEYLRNTALDANDYFSKQNGLSRSSYHQHQYGGTIGGPVVIPHVYDGRNKTFFFFDYQRTSIGQPFPSTQTVPTAAMANSGFTNLQDLITYNSGTGTDGLGRIIPHGTVLDPATTRAVAGKQVDPVTGLFNPSASTIYVRDPFFAGGVQGIKDFTPSYET